MIAFLSSFLAPYAGKWILDFASFRPFEEDGRDLPLHKRNDLLHVDAFPSRPTRGGRILRVFTNLNLSKPRVWQTTGPFESFAQAVCQRRRTRMIAENDSLLSAQNDCRIGDASSECAAWAERPTMFSCCASTIS